MPDRLHIAAAQFPVSGDRPRNARYIHAQIAQAAKRGAHVVLFPETALAGYAPRHLPDLSDYDWQGLQDETDRIASTAKTHGVWTIFGTMRRDENGRIRNTLQVVSAAGEPVAAYDKRRLYHSENLSYVPGHQPCVFELGGLTCGLLICYDNCFPELYDDYRDRGVQLIFHAFYNAANRAVSPIADMMAANLIVRAADNRCWIAASNSSETYSPLPASIVRPDGSSVRARRNTPGLVVAPYCNEGLGWTYDNRAVG